MQDLHFLSSTALELLALPPQANLYQFIGEKLGEIVPESIVSVSSYDSTSGSLVTRALIGLGKYSTEIIKLIGWNPIDVPFRINDEEARSHLLKGTLFKGPGSIHELTFGKIPRSISHRVERLLGIGDIYGIGFSWGGEFYGSAMIASRSTESLLKKKETIEAFIHQASIALQRREVENALRESEQRYRSIFQNSRDGIVLFHSDDRILAANPEACRMHGYTEEEILGLSRDDIVDTGDPRLRESIEKRIQTGFFKGEVTHARKDGSKFPCEVTTAAIQDNNPLKSRVAIFRDVTERKQIEEEKERMAERLAESERRYRSLFESMSEGFVLFRVLRDEKGNPADFQYLEMNPAWERLIRLSRKEAAGKLASEVLPDAMTWDVVLARNVLGSPNAFKIERYSRWAGKWLEYCAYSPGQDLMAVLFTDITERKRAEEALRAARDELEMRVRKRTAELERRNRELQDFAFVASHDLREPIRKIQTLGDLLMLKGADHLNEMETDYINRMSSAANRMQQLLDALLRYSRIQNKKKDFEPVRLEDIAKKAAGDLDVSVRQIGARIEIGRLPSIMGNPYQLLQLFQNLIGNAAKYSRPDVKPFIRVYAEEHGGVCDIFVEDNGIGFDEKYLDKIFQPFQRLHAKHEYSGTGIGLSICKKIVESHGGTIIARSTPGKGSTFIVTLPLRGADNNPD